MREDPALADHHRSYPDGPPAVRVDTPTPTSSRPPPPANLRHWRCTSRLATWPRCGPHSAELYRRDGIQITDAEVEAQADHLALLERGDRFLKDVATRLHPDGELLALARQVDDHGLGVWREAAGSLVDDCPPSLVHLRWRIEEEQRAELRSHAQLLRREAQLGTSAASLGSGGAVVAPPAGRRVGEPAGRLPRAAGAVGAAPWPSGAKLQVMENTERARAAWEWQTREVLVRGVAATQVLVERRTGPGRPSSLTTASGPVRGRDPPPTSGASLQLARLPAASGGDGGLCAAEPTGRAPTWRLAGATAQVCLARGTVLVARFDAQQPVLPGLGGIAATRG